MQEYCVTSIFRARGLSGLRYCPLLCYRVQLLPGKNHHQFNPARAVIGRFGEGRDYSVVVVGGRGGQI